MATITVRKLDDATVEGLKARAKVSGRSMEEEVRAILNREARPGKLSGQAAADHFREFQKKHFGDRVFPAGTTLEILRELREEDSTGRDWK